jgi:hypothetical protein
MCWSFGLRESKRATGAHPAPESPSPWRIMTVAVCLVVAGSVIDCRARGVAIVLVLA